VLCFSTTSAKLPVNDKAEGQHAERTDASTEGMTMPTGGFARIAPSFVTAAVVLWGAWCPRNRAVQGATQREGPHQATEIPMISDKNAQASQLPTRQVIDRFNEAFNRHGGHSRAFTDR
jgi:hypothetical protein